MSMVLLVGGAGFIGSHTAVELIGQGYEVVVAHVLQWPPQRGANL